MKNNTMINNTVNAAILKDRNMNVSIDDLKTDIKGGLKVTIKGLKLESRKDRNDGNRDHTDFESYSIDKMEIGLNGRLDLKAAIKIGKTIVNGGDIHTITGSIGDKFNPIDGNSDLDTSIKIDGIQMRKEYHQKGDRRDRHHVAALAAEGMEITGSLEEVSKGIVEVASEMKQYLKDDLEKQKKEDERKKKVFEGLGIRPSREDEKRA